MTRGEAGKGDRPRPCNRKKWAEGYERAFGKPKPRFFEGLRDAIIEGVDEMKESQERTNE